MNNEAEKKEEVKKGFIKKAWEFVDGKKTAIGTIMAIASNIFPEYTVMHNLLYWGGQLIGGTGVVHKAVKGQLKLISK
jgi:hypothetical protein